MNDLSACEGALAAKADVGTEKTLGLFLAWVNRKADFASHYFRLITQLICPHSKESGLFWKKMLMPEDLSRGPFLECLGKKCREAILSNLYLKTERCILLKLFVHFKKPSVHIKNIGITQLFCYGFPSAKTFRDLRETSSGRKLLSREERNYWNLLIYYGTERCLLDWNSWVYQRLC